MNKSGWKRPARAWAACCLAAATFHGMPMAWAQSGNLLSNPTFLNINPATNLPDGYWDQRGFEASCASGLGPLPVTHSYGSEGGVPYMDIDVHNTSANCPANYVLVMPMVSGGNSLVLGADYRMSGTVKVLTNDGGSKGSLGYHLEAPTTFNYLGEIPGFYVNGLSGDQSIAVDYSAGEPSRSGVVPGSVLPRLTAYSIKAGQHLRLRLKNLSVTRSAVATAVTVKGLVNPVLMAGSGKWVKMSVPVKPIAYTGGQVTSTVNFLDANGVVKGTWAARPVSFLSATSWGTAYDAWESTLPALPAGRYTIRYNLSLPASQTQAGDGATESTTPSGAKRYDIGTLIVSDKAGMYVGQHFHRYPGPNLPGTPLPSGLNYKFARSHNHDGSAQFVDSMTSMRWWTGDNQYNWALFDAWADFHAGAQGSGHKKLLITFMGSPPWLTSNSNYNTFYPDHGLLAAPTDLAVYKRMVTATVNRYKDRIFAVECWNEPDVGFFGPNPASPLSTETQLADICKAIHTATKAIDPNIPTICPQVSVPEHMQTWLGARTSQNEPITDYCDVVGAHTYGRTGLSPSGQHYISSTDGLIQSIRNMRATLQSMGIKKPIAITESGFVDGANEQWTDNLKFSSKTPALRAEISYQTLATARELGVVLFGLYSFDGGADPIAPLGFEGNGFGSPAAAANQIVNTRNSAAVADLGASGAGLLPTALDLFMVPTGTTVSMAGSTALNFKLTVANTNMVAGRSLAVSILPSASSYESGSGATGPAGSSVYTIDSLVGPAGSSCTPSMPSVNGQTVTQWTCQNMNVPAGEFVTLVANGRATPSSNQLMWMNWWNYTYNFTVSASAAWADRPAAVPAPVVTSPKIVVTQ